MVKQTLDMVISGKDDATPAVEKVINTLKSLSLEIVKVPTAPVKKLIDVFRLLSVEMLKIQAMAKQVGSAFSQFANAKGIFDPVNMQLREVVARQDKAIERMNRFKTVGSAIADSMSKRNNWAAPLEGIPATIGRSTKELDRFGRAAVRARNDLEKLSGRGGISGPFKGLKNSLRGLSGSFKRFRMEFLGIMFLGMALQRVFTRIMRSTTTMFKKIMESSGISGTAIQRLTTHWEFLKFTIGSAINSTLAPLMPMITNLINSFSEWVGKNKKLVGGFLIIGLIVGALLFIFGQFAIGLNSIIMLIAGPFGQAVGGGLSALAGVGLGTILAVVGMIIAAIIILKALWDSNFGGIQDSIGGIVSGIFVTIKSVFGDIWDIVKNFFFFFKSIFEGNWEDAGVFLIKILAALVRGVAKLVLAILMILANAVGFVINVVKDLLVNIFLGYWLFVFKKIAGTIDWLMGKLGKKTNLEGFVDRMKMGIDKISDKLTIPAFSGDNFKGMTKWVDKLQVPDSMLSGTQQIKENMEGAAESAMGIKEAGFDGQVQPVEKIIDLKVEVEAKGDTFDEEAVANKLGDIVGEKLLAETKANLTGG